MHKLHKVLKQIHKEFEAAEDYLHCASVAENDDVEDLYKTLCKEELTHAEKLMNMCEKHLEQDMRPIWEFEKEMLKHKHLFLKTEWSHLD